MVEQNRDHTIKELFDAACETELRFAAIYKKFAAIFSDDPSLAEFWTTLAADEIGHEKTLRTIANSLNTKQLASLADNDLYYKIHEVRHLLDENEAARIINLDDAYELSHLLEFSELNWVFKILTTGFFPSQEKEQFILLHITEHQNKIESFSKKFGNKSWRQSVPARHS